MLTLFHAPRSRSSGFLWLLEEIGAPYVIQYVSIRRGAGSGALDSANPHPHGKVPLLKDGSSMVFERTAIALYLADKFPNARSGRPLTIPGAVRSGFLRRWPTTRGDRAGVYVEIHEGLRTPGRSRACLRMSFRSGGSAAHLTQPSLDQRVKNKCVRPSAVTIKINLGFLALLAPAAVGVHLGEFRSQQENLGGIEDPQQDDHQRPCRAIGGGNRAGAEVPADDRLANRE